MTLKIIIKFEMICVSPTVIADVRWRSNNFFLLTMAQVGIFMYIV